MLKTWGMSRSNGEGNNGNGTATKKRVRFLDNSLAQELIKREKSRLDSKIQFLRQKYNFTKEVEKDSDDEQKEDSVFEILPQTSLTRQHRSNSYSELSATDRKQARPNSSGGRRSERSGSLSRLDELAQPRGRGKLSSSQSARRKSTMIALSPEHLRLSIPQKAPRTKNQLKELPDDEMDYLLQPKSLKEFYAMADMIAPPSRSSSQLSGRSTPSQRRKFERPQSSNKTMSDTSNRDRNMKVTPAATEINVLPEPAEKPKFKPSLKMAATGVMSMNVRQPTKQTHESLALKAWTKALGVQSPNPVTGHYRLAGGRVLRLRPRQAAWQEQADNDGNRNGSPRPRNNSNDDNMQGNNIDKEDKLTPRTGSTESTNATSNYRWRTDTRSIDVSQLTKDLAKCQYLRRKGESEVIDVADIFKK